MQLTAEQQRVVGLMQQHYERGSVTRPLVVKGWAGTGKTTIAAHAVMPHLCLGIAPTHKAAAVLARKLPGVEVRTIHSALGYRAIVDDETGDRKFVRGGEGTMGEYRQAIVDEGSMIGAELWLELYEGLLIDGVRAVVLGDPHQLPPVGEATSPALEGAAIELVEVMRSQGALTDAVCAIRAQMYKGDVPWLWESVRDAQGQVVAHRDQRSMQATWLDMVVAGEDVVCAAWTNAAVDQANRVARKAVVGENADPYVAGEWMVMVEAHDVCLHTEDRVRILHARKATHPTHKLPAWRVGLSTPDGDHEVWAPDNADEWQRAYKAAHAAARGLKGVDRRVGFQRAFAIRDAVAWMRPHYATTIHKAQGSTWDHVFVMRDVWSCQDARLRDRLIYVAASRAARSLHMGVWR